MLAVLVVVPCFNEAVRLDGAAFVRHVQDHPRVRFLFVDDGSTDRTPQLLQELAAACPGRIACISLPENLGKAEAVRQGMQRALATQPPADVVGFWDADLATPLSDILDFTAVLAKEPRFLAVFGSRVNLLGRDVRRKLWRHYLGRVFATAASTMLRLPIYDTQCGAKLFRVTDDIRAVFAQPFVSAWIFDVEVLARLRDRLIAVGGPPAREVIFEYPLMVWHDIAGSKVRIGHFARVFVDMARIWWRSGRGRR